MIALGATTQRLRLAYAKSPVPAFLDWWGRELIAMLPVSLRSWLRAGSAVLHTRYGENHWQFERAENGHVTALTSVERKQQVDVARAAVAHVLSQFEGSDPAASLQIEESEILCCELRLPAAAEENLREVLGFEMDRHTPFAAADVFFDFQVEGRDDANNMLDISLYLLPKTVLEPRVRELNKLGLALDRVGVDSAKPLKKLNLLPSELCRKRRNIRARMNWALALLTVVLAAVLSWNSQHQKQQYIIQLEAKIAVAMKEARETARLRKRLVTAVEGASFLLEKKRQHPLVLELLNEVTKLLPDDAWVQRFQLKGREVQIQGQSEAANSLLAKLEASLLLTGAEVQGAITDDKKTKKERFNIKVQAVEPEEKSDGAAAAG